MIFISVCTLLSVVLCGSHAGDPWRIVDKVLELGIKEKVYPGYSAGVIDASGELIYEAFGGHFTYGAKPPHNPTENPDVTEDTLFDMASITKIMGPTIMTAYLYQQGYLDLDSRVSNSEHLGTHFAQNGKRNITIRNLLMHDSGLYPDPFPHDYWKSGFGCPATSIPGVPMDFTCIDKAYASLLKETLQYPIGTQFVYSDLSMITMQYVLGNLIQKRGWIDAEQEFSPACQSALPVTKMSFALRATCYYEAFWMIYIVPRIGLTSTQYILPPTSRKHAAPTWNDTFYRKTGVVQGVVSDGNAYALGGIAGHAGLFSTGPDVARFLSIWQFAPHPHAMPKDVQPGLIVRPSSHTQEAYLRNKVELDRNRRGDSSKQLRTNQLPRASKRPMYISPLLNSTTVDTFLQPSASYSPRALGWVVQNHEDAYKGCGNFHEKTAYHTGYTGTLICFDPVKNVTSYLLTSRVYDDHDANSVEIKFIRQTFHNAVLVAMNRK